MRRVLCALLLVLAAAPASAVELRPHDLVVLDPRLKAVLRVDPESGDREVVTSPEVGSGKPFLHPTDLELMPDGGILVLDRNRHTVVRVDPASGDREILLPASRGRRLGALRAVVRTPRGDYLLGLSNRKDGIHRFDAASGETRPLAWRVDGPRRSLSNPIGIALGQDALYVADSRSGVLELDPEGGEGRAVAVIGKGEGQPREPFDIAVSPDGALFVADKAGRQVLRVEPGSGEVRVISGHGVGSGETFRSPAGLALEADGRLLLVDRDRGAIFRVDPESGDRRILASREVGQGPLAVPRRVVVVPVRPGLPAGWLAAGALAVLVAGAVAWRRGRRG